MATSILPGTTRSGGHARTFKPGAGLRMRGATSGRVGILPPATITDYDLTLPGALGASDKLLQVSSAGVISLVDPVGPAGSGTELAYRNVGAFGAVAGSSWDGTTLIVPTLAVVSGAIGFTSSYPWSISTSINGFRIRDNNIGRDRLIIDRLGPFYLGNGITSSAPLTATLYGTGGSGTNVVGGSLYIAPGPSTGNATPSAVVIQSTVAGSSGSTAQTLVDTLWVTGGKVGVGVTPATLFEVRKDQNAATYATVHNNTSGTAAYAGLFVGDALDTRSVGTLALSAGFTTSGMLVASTGAIFSSCANGLNVGTNQNAQVSIWTNNVKRLEISSAGLATLTGDFAVASTNFHYWGASNTDGSWRIGRSGNDIVIERRESGVWVTKSTITA